MKDVIPTRVPKEHAGMYPLKLCTREEMAELWNQVKHLFEER